MTKQKQQDDDKRQNALQVRDSRVFAFMDQLEKAEKFPIEIRKGVVSMLNEKIKYMMDWETAEMISSSDLVPKDYVGKPNNVFLAIQTGRSLGLDPFQSVKHLYTVNGRTSLFGDMMLALAKGHDEYSDTIEEFGEMVEAGKDHGMLPSYAKCTIRRKDNKVDIVREYTLEDAKHNPNFYKFNKDFSTGKWDAPGTWMRNGKRMMQMRARSFALRDAFPDKLSGVYDEYEILEIKESPKDITSESVDLGKQNGADGLKDSLKEDEASEPGDVEIQDKDGKKISPDEEEPKAQEPPKNIDEIKEDFNAWKKGKQISAKEYKAFGEAGSTGKWDIVVEMHKKFKKNIVIDPEPTLGEFAQKLDNVVNDNEYGQVINELLSEGVITPPDEKQNVLRTTDEKVAKEVFEKIEERKGMHDAAQKEEKKTK